MATLQKIRSKGPLLVIIIGLALFAFIAGDAWRALQPHTGKQDVGEIDGEAVSAQDYQKLLEEYTEVYKFTRGANNISEEEMAQIKDEVWNTLVSTKLLEAEADKVGLKVTDAEMKAILEGGEHPLLQQTPFVNPQTRKFDVNLLKKFLDDYSKMDINQMPQDYVEYYTMLNNYWTFIEKTIRQNALAEKYNNLLSHSFVANPVAAKEAYEGRTGEMELLLAAIPYTAVADSTITVSESELKSLYNEKKEQYRQYAESRDIKYIDVVVNPSQADRNELEKEVGEYAANLASTDSEYAAFVRSTGSSVAYSEVPMRSKAYPNDIANRLDTAVIGKVYGTYYNRADDSYNTFKVIAKVNEPDSVQYRLIQVVDADENKRITLADSIYNALKGGADFAELAKKYAQAGEPVWISSSQYEGAALEAENAKYVNTLNNTAVNALTNLNLGQVNLIIQVLDRKGMTDKYNVAVVKRQVDFSKETYSKAYNDFSQFVAANNTLEKLEANAEDSGYRLLERPSFYNNAHSVGNIANTKDAVRWIFDAEKGDVSPLYECGNNEHMLVVALSDINKEGYVPFEKVKDVLKAEVIQNKKAEMLMKELKGVTSFEQVKSIANVVTDTVKHVTFNTSAYVTVTRSSEPVLGAYASKAELNKVTSPIKGNAGVYLIQVYKKDNAEGTFNAEVESNTLNAISMRAASRFMNDLYMKAEVKDSRYLFF